MQLKSDYGIINQPTKKVFEYLSDLNNYIELLPADKITDWESDVDSCSFKIKGATTIGFQKKSVEPFNRINLISGDKSPIDFDLTIILSENGDETKGHIEFESNVNPFLRMMIEKPLKNLFGHMVEKMEDKFK